MTLREKGSATSMSEFVKVCVTIQMQNDFENAETCFTVTMTDKKAKYLLDEIRGKSTILGDAIYETVHDIAKANASLMGYHIKTIASAQLLD